MTLPDDQAEEIKAICAEAQLLADGPLQLIHFPRLSIETDGNTIGMEALLCLSAHQGYSTRLFLSNPIVGKLANWTVHSILGRQWHTWSWQGIQPSDRPAQILAQHLRALR